MNLLGAIPGVGDAAKTAIKAADRAADAAKAAKAAAGAGKEVAEATVGALGKREKKRAAKKAAKKAAKQSAQEAEALARQEAQKIKDEIVGSLSKPGRSGGAVGAQLDKRAGAELIRRANELPKGPLRDAYKKLGERLQRIGRSGVHK